MFPQPSGQPKIAQVEGLGEEVYAVVVSVHGAAGAGEANLFAASALVLGPSLGDSFDATRLTETWVITTQQLP